MGAPKKKPTRMKRDQRRAHFKATVPNLIECPHCHELIPSHTVVLTVMVWWEEKIKIEKEEKG